ncbi:MAG TPA: hypothetical protein VHE55_05225 [Fimbriimonadaceae bacterium]|nr:hypothetical protein [Fimbriimonadaceae bacterium]
MLLAYVVAAVVGSLQKGSVETGNGLTTVTFATPGGAVRVYLPSDIAAGDTISGTVVPDPSAPNGNDYKVDLGTVEGEVVGPNRPDRTWKLPDKAGNVPITLRDSQGRSIGTASVNVARPKPPLDAFTIPPILIAGRTSVITGPFDGKSGNTATGVSGARFPILAESPRQSIAIIPPTVSLGSGRLTVGEDGKHASAPVDVVKIQLTTPKTVLRKGEKTSLHIEVTGLDPSSNPPPLRIMNRTPSTIELEGGSNQTVPIPPDQVGPERPFELDRQITSKVEGSFSIFVTLDMRPGTTVPPSTGSLEGSVVSGPGASAIRDRFKSADPALLGTSLAFRLGAFDGRYYDIASPIGKGPCDLDYAHLFDLLNALQQALDENTQAIESNPLMQELRLYELIGKLLQNPQQLIDAIKQIVDGKIKECFDSLGTRDGAVKALDFLGKVIDFVVAHDSSLTPQQRSHLKDLRAGIDKLVKGNDSLDELEKKVENLIEELKKLVDDPIGLLADKLENGLKSMLEKTIAEAIGEKAAGAMFSMLNDLMNFADFLKNQAKHDELRQKINDLLQGIWDKASEDPCHRIDSGWSDRIKPYLWLTGPDWTRSHVKLTPKVYCYDAEKKRYRICPDGGVKIVGDSGSGDSLESDTGNLGAGQEFKLPYKYDLSHLAKCGDKCLLLLQVEYQRGDGSAGTMLLFQGALP